MKRRTFLQTVGGVGAAMAAGTVFAQETKETPQLHVAVNQFTCNNIYRRDNKDFWDCLDELKGAGVDGIEPTVGSAEEMVNIAERLRKHGLECRSLYTGANLHDENVAINEIQRISKLAEKAKTFGTKIIVFNPAAKKGKTDAELVLQSQNADRLGELLRQLGISFAFHYHTTELEFGGREFHHLMCGTDPKNVAICFEEHWSYRASGNSQVAVFDHLKLYGDRATEVHLRQSVDNVWSETFGDGDIDNVRLAEGIKKIGIKPHFVLEQAAENGTPKTIPAVETFRRSVDYIRRVFG